MRERLEVIIVPSATVMLVLPAAMIRQILPYAPVIPEASSLSYLRGTLIVQQHKLNVIDLSELVHGRSQEEQGRGEKLIWVSSLRYTRALSGYVLQASATPSFMSCSEHDITRTATGDHPLISSYVAVKGMENPDELPVIIPNLQKLESELMS